MTRLTRLFALAAFAVGATLAAGSITPAADEGSAAASRLTLETQDLLVASRVGVDEDGRTLTLASRVGVDEDGRSILGQRAIAIA
ncbi:MAG TPA: hypothetical protein VMT85_01060 [Thermoanaerobaculia bacterium]|nr:hypothetical protein [Thermoanaerobaculia bacterium]